MFKKCIRFCGAIFSIGVFLLRPVLSNEMDIKLPKPKISGHVSLEETLYKRKSVRSYKKEPLTITEIGQLLWAAQGKAAYNNRTSPSAGATYPVEVYLSVGKVNGLTPGLYHYLNRNHSLELVKKGDIRRELSGACLGQPMIEEAPVCIIIDAVLERSSSRYGQRAERYIAMEAGHIGQNIYLQSTALCLGTVAVGAFDDDRLKKLIPELTFPLYVFPVGKQ